MNLADCRLGTALVKMMAVLAGSNDSKTDSDSNPDNQKLTASC
ncbi:hypothetical protein [Microcoleus sp. FACHB-672]|nr:hypothetical protein [Microcoleus sp. FACHB-672]